MTPTPAATPARTLLEGLRHRQAEMIDCLAVLVNEESPSGDPELLGTALDAVDDMLVGLAGSGSRRVERGGVHLVWETGRPRALLLCHVDTVWPRGTLARWPFSVDGGRATGPGVVDMKAGIVQALFALSALGMPESVRLLVTTDEEVGSPSSRALIEESTAGLEAVLVLEASYEGALKVARKGTAQYTVQIRGRAWHASEPDRGANATLEMARQMLDVAALADARLGTTATPTLAAAGTTANTVPAHAEFRVDSRAASTAELERIERAMRVLRPHLDGTEITVLGGIDRTPMSREISRGLFERAQAVAATLGLPPLRGVLAPGVLGRPVHRRHGHPHSGRPRRRRGPRPRRGGVGRDREDAGAGRAARRPAPGRPPQPQRIRVGGIPQMAEPPRGEAGSRVRPTGPPASTPPAPSGTGPAPRR